MPAPPARGVLRKVSVAILSWNGRDHLASCLAALAAQHDPGVDWEVLVLDNGSSDGTAEWVRRHHPEVRLIESRRNLGFCAGNNRLVEAADGDAVAFLNNDTRAERGWLAALVAALGDAPPEVAAVSGLIVDWDGERLDFGRGVMTFDGHAFQLGFREPLSAAATQRVIPEDGSELLFACGGNMLVRRDSFLAAGGFDAGYFAYLEDVDLGWRLWSGGERVRFARDAVVRHRSSATSDLLGLYHRGFLFERNAFLTAYKNYEAGLWERVMPAVLLTFNSRTQTLLEQNNPAGALLAVDPYAGLIANTGSEEPVELARGASVPAAPASPTPRPPGAFRRAGGLGRKVREIGLKEAARRALRRLLGLPAAPLIADPRSQAQLRAQAYLLRHLDRAAAARRRVQARRTVSDREIFERFPPYLVATYPGDEALFGGEGFRAWLPEDLPLVESTLGELMRWGR